MDDAEPRDDRPATTTPPRILVRNGLIGAAIGFVVALVWPRPWKA